MSVVLDAATSDWLSSTTVPVINEPFFWVAWFKSNNVTASVVIVGQADSTVEVLGFWLQAAGLLAGDPLRAGTFVSSASTSTGYSADTWTHAAAFYKADNDRRAYISGGNSNTQTTSRPSTANRFSIGAHAHLTPAGFFDGNIAHVAVYDATGLSDATVEAAIVSLAAGRNPQAIEAGALVEHWELDGDANADFGSNDLTENGTITYDTGDNPTVDGPPRQLRVSGHRYFW